MYGQLPKDLGYIEVNCNEMMFYLYLPIKMKGESSILDSNLEKRLHCCIPVIGKAACDYIATRGLSDWRDSYVYLSIKRMWQDPNTSYNRPGWHSDGFMTDDYNYIWSDCCPTVFNDSVFNITMDDRVSLSEMEAQADPSHDITYPDYHLIRLDQYNIHRVGMYDKGCVRTFIKISVSKDKYDLVGNSKNYNLDYDWDMRERDACRNVPQKLAN